jgi:hypothetical protein
MGFSTYSFQSSLTSGGVWGEIPTESFDHRIMKRCHLVGIWRNIQYVFPYTVMTTSVDREIALSDGSIQLGDYRRRQSCNLIGTYCPKSDNRAKYISTS